MSNTPLITNKEEFLVQATDFFNTIFEPALEREYGEIEIRIFPEGRPAQFFFTSESEAAEKALELCNFRENVYFGVNPRIGKAGKKDNVKYLRPSMLRSITERSATRRPASIKAMRIV